MSNKDTARGRRHRGSTLNTIVNVAVLLFLGYAVLWSGSPLRTKFREYTLAREAAQGILDQLASEGRVDNERPTIIEFADFQCPPCREMHDVLRAGVAERRFDLVVMHFPLEQIHPLAKPAAEASLCADAQRHAADMNHLLMSTSDWMDHTDWSRLVRDAGVPDLLRFEECLDAPSTAHELARHVAVTRDIGVTGTPAFVSHGGIRRGVATLEELEQLAKK